MHQIRFRPDPAEGAYSAPAHLLAGLRGALLLRGKEGTGEEREGRTGKGGDGRGRDRKGGEGRERREGKGSRKDRSPFWKFLDSPL